MMNINIRLVISVPCILAAVILGCMTYELLSVAHGICPICIYDHNAATVLCLASVVWSFLFALPIVWKLDITRAEKLFWIGVAALPVLFFAILALFQ